MTSNEDEFWNESSSSRQNFFDDEDEDTTISTETFNQQLTLTLPIHSIISNECLSLFVDDTDSALEHVVASPQESIKSMFHSDNVLLTAYRSQEDKLKLLDAAIELADGNIILTVSLNAVTFSHFFVIRFLSQTLNNNIFFTQLSKRKVAVKHYANYLIEKNNLQQLSDLYMATGNIYNLKDIYCLYNKEISNKTVLHKKLQQFNLQNTQNLHNNEDKQEILDNIRFLEFQMQHKFDSKSLIAHLIHLYMLEYQKGSDEEVVTNFKKQFQIDDFQYDWVLMNILCKMENWDRLLSRFIKSVWMLKKRALNTVARPELFIIGIKKHNPPEEIMEHFLSCIGDASKALSLAEKLKLHKHVINYYVEQRDKMSLLKYMERVEPGSAAMSFIQSNLINPDIKWKN